MFHQWKLGQRGSGLNSDGLDFLLKRLDLLFLLLGGFTAAQVSDFSGDGVDSLGESLNRGRQSGLLLLGVLDLGLDNLLLRLNLGVLQLLFIGLDVLLNDLEFLLGGGELKLGLLLNLGLLVDLGVDGGFELLDLLDLAVELLLLLEGLNLGLNNGDLLGFLLDILLLGADDNFRDGDLLLDFLLELLNLVDLLSDVGHLSSGGGLLGDGLFSGFDKSFDFLLGINDFGGDLVDLLLELGLLSDANNLDLLLQLLLLSDELSSGRGDGVNLGLSLSNLLGGGLNSRLQVGGLG